MNKLSIILIITLSIIYCKSKSVKDVQDQYSTIILKQTKTKAKIQGFGSSKEVAIKRAKKRAESLFDYFKLFKKTKCKKSSKKFELAGNKATCIIYAKKSKPTIADVKSRKEKFSQQFTEYDEYWILIKVIAVKNLSVQFLSQILFSNVTLQFNDKNKYAIVGFDFLA